MRYEQATLVNAEACQDDELARFDTEGMIKHT
jgi:hypothetical protein